MSSGKKGVTLEKTAEGTDRQLTWFRAEGLSFGHPPS